MKEMLPELYNHQTDDELIQLLPILNDRLREYIEPPENSFSVSLGSYEYFCEAKTAVFKELLRRGRIEDRHYTAWLLTEYPYYLPPILPKSNTTMETQTEQGKSFAERMGEVTNLRELYDFRRELVDKQEVDSLLSKKDIVARDFRNMEELNFFLARVDARIKHLEANGIFLDKIKT